MLYPMLFAGSVIFLFGVLVGRLSKKNYREDNNPHYIKIDDDRRSKWAAEGEELPRRIE